MNTVNFSQLWSKPCELDNALNITLPIRNPEAKEAKNISKSYKTLSPQAQIIFLAEAEKVFAAYDKIPSMVWEEEYRKYSEVLQTYQNIRMMRWNEEKK